MPGNEGPGVVKQRMHRASLDPNVWAHLLDGRPHHHGVVSAWNEIARPTADEPPDGPLNEAPRPLQSEDVALDGSDCGQDSRRNTPERRGLPAHGGEHGPRGDQRPGFGPQTPGAAAAVELDSTHPVWHESHTCPTTRLEETAEE